MAATLTEILSQVRNRREMLREAVPLSTGKSCELVTIRDAWIPHYYLLAFPSSQGEPTVNEVSEMLSVGVERANHLAQEYVGDPEAYGLVYSGYSARREKGWHVHIILLGNRWRKAWLYFVLAGKNLLQALRLRKDDAPRTR